MRAAQIDKQGEDSHIEVVANAPAPVPQDGEVLVKIKAAGVNAADWKIKSGKLQNPMQLTFPATIGGDGAGVVAQLGPGVTEFRIGDEVYGQGDFMHNGTFAEFAPMKVSRLALKPAKADFIHAAVLPTTAVCAYQTLRATSLKKNQKILIHGGAGGVGSFAIQLAKSMGAYVATTATGTGMAFTQQLGADQVIDYRTEDFAAKLKDFDIVLDTVGGETYTRSFGILKKGGLIITLVTKPDEESARQYGVRALLQLTEVTTQDLTRIAQLVDQRKISITIDKVFRLEDTPAAVDYMEHGQHLGKIAIVIE